MFKIDLFFIFFVEIDLVFDQNNAISPKALPVVKRGRTSLNKQYLIE